jgi:hypothetical protein
MRKRGFLILLSAILVGASARFWFHHLVSLGTQKEGSEPFPYPIPFNLAALYTWISVVLGIFLIVIDLALWLRNRRQSR